MTKLNRSRSRYFRAAINRSTLVAALLVVPAVGTVTTAFAGAEEVVERWANNVWEAARDGDVTALEQQFDRLPAGQVSIESAGTSP